MGGEKIKEDEKEWNCFGLLSDVCIKGHRIVITNDNNKKRTMSRGGFSSEHWKKVKDKVTKFKDRCVKVETTTKMVSGSSGDGDWSAEDPFWPSKDWFSDIELCDSESCDGESCDC